MKLLYFIPKPETAADCKEMYRKLSMQHHPDRPTGDTETMKQVNNEFDYLWSQVKNIYVNSKGETYNKETEETAEEFRNIINQIIYHQHVKIEIIGSFIWIHGETKHYKEIYKTLGFKWSTNKCAWYKPPAGYRKASRKDWSLDDIRNRFDSETIENKERDKVSAA